MSNSKLTWFLLSLFAVALLVPEMALATDTILGNTLCAVVDWFTGNTGQGIATLAIIIIGVGALLGKVSWGMAIIVGLGVAIIFGAGNLIEAMDTDGGDTCA